MMGMVRCRKCRKLMDEDGDIGGHNDKFPPTCNLCRNTPIRYKRKFYGEMSIPKMSWLWRELCAGKIPVEDWKRLQWYLVRVMFKASRIYYSEKYGDFRVSCYAVRKGIYAARLLLFAYMLDRGIPGIRGHPLIMRYQTGRVARAKRRRRKRRLKRDGIESAGFSGKDFVGHGQI